MQCKINMGFQYPLSNYYFANSTHQILIYMDDRKRSLPGKKELYVIFEKKMNKIRTMFYMMTKHRQKVCVIL